MMNSNEVPTLQYRGKVYNGEDKVNFYLRKEGVGLSRLNASDLQTLNATDLSKASDDQLLSAFRIERQELRQLAWHGRRELAMPLADINMETVGTSEQLGHPGAYPKVYRLTDENAGLFNTDSLAKLHVNRHINTADDIAVEVDEFHKILSGRLEWFFLIDGAVGLLSVPAGWQITYPGLGEHGGYIHEQTRAVVVSEIVGPAEWEMIYTGSEAVSNPNPFLSTVE